MNLFCNSIVVFHKVAQKHIKRYSVKFGPGMNRDVGFGKTNHSGEAGIRELMKHITHLCKSGFSNNCI